MKRIALMFVLCGAASGCAAAESPPTLEAQVGGFVTAFQDGVAPSASYGGTRDTMLEQHAATARHAGDKKLSVSGDTPSGSDDDDVVALQWDVSAIPTSAVVVAATITLHVTDKADQPYTAFELLRTWDETTATWNRASTASNWDSNGADGDTDRGAAALGTIRAAATGTFTIALTAAGLAAVQRWVSDPRTNHGVVLAGGDNANRLEFSSREDSKANRPRLEVSWLPGGGGGGAPGSYRETCDGSAAVALDATHFLDFNDESQVARIYTRGASAAPVQQLDLGRALGMATGDEADLEDAARVGDRVYVIASHGRNKDGELAATRDRFVAIDLAGAVPAIQLTVAGWTDRLIVDLLAASNWEHPDATVIAALAAATQLAKPTVADLAPEVHGLNIEGLAAYPSAIQPQRLIFGLRNPQSAGRAILITLLNPADVIAGATARFGELITLDLGGLGVRSLAWSAVHQAMFVIGGPIGDAGAVRLYRWSGDPASAPVVVQDLASPAATAAEAVVVYPGSQDLQILFDAGGLVTGGTTCKQQAASAQVFTDQIIHVP